jgi:predicted dehydrogenase
MIDAGKHVLVEKPLATTVEDAEAITRAAQKKGVRFMTDFQNRWNPPFAHAKQLLDSGELGSPVSAYIRLSGGIGVVDRIPWSAQSGPQWFLGPHIVDLVRWLFGQEPKRVFATGRRGILSKKGFDIYDALQAQIVFPDAFATVETAWILPPTWPSLDFRMDILTTSGKLEINPIGDTISVAGERFRRPFITGQGNAFGKMLGFFREPILHFIDCVRDDSICVVDPEDGLAVTRTLVAIEESIESGKIVELHTEAE